jgi:hypothetical protein
VDRTSKRLITGWAIVALLAECWFVSGAWPVVAWAGPLILLIAALVASVDRRIAAPVLAVSYLVPILIFEMNGRYHVNYSVLWLAGLLGVTLPDALRRSWQVPQQWRVPLVCWVAGVCATAPMIVLRAVDFRTELLFRGRLPMEALGGLPLLTVGWVLHVALLLVIGLLWFDWLCGQEPRFVRRWITLPLAASGLLLAAVCLYQLFVDVTFLNYSVYAMFSRASGTLLDGNAAGAISAYWIGGWTVYAVGTHGLRRAGALGLAGLMWLPVWATGSRTALASALIITVACLASLLRGVVTRRRLILAGLFASIAVVAVVGMVSRPPAGAAGPLSRIQRIMPAPNVASLRAFATEMWNRNGYGAAATMIIDRHPMVGIGVGSFHEMAIEFYGHNLTPDNAQNWYRHQLAELGVVGSLGWLVFLGLFGWWVVRPHAGEPSAAWPTRGVLVAVALVSLLGMPGQDPFVAITLWTFAAWHLAVAGRPADASPARPWAWAVATLVVLVFAAGTAQLAAGRLRVPMRIAQAQGVAYSYGFWWPEPDAEGGELRWARREATAVVPVHGRVLELTLRANPDMLGTPLRVRAMVDGQPLIAATLTADAPEVHARRLLSDGTTAVVVDTWADRATTLPPPDGRELAMMVRWRFAPSWR